ncbi:unannotated protein [freshwater metagenome]|uniref:Unannotated protein n=1 Tax=freshwater metagenome TaxID=449393 RepID=A0A6J7GZN6_9ZZZZ|nr:hypothetical protein [Actinomycetota bacterium]
MLEQDPVDVPRLTARVCELLETEPDVVDMSDEAVERAALILRPLLQPATDARAAV